MILITRRLYISFNPLYSDCTSLTFGFVVVVVVAPVAI
jgi:hypothetical protein